VLRSGGKTSLSELANGAGFEAIERPANDVDEDEDDDDLERSPDFEYEVCLPARNLKRFVNLFLAKLITLDLMFFFLFI